MKKRKKVLLGIIISIVLAITAIVITLSSTSALFTHSDTSTRRNNYNTGILSITAISKSDVISLDNTLPMSDEQGIAQDPYIFTVKNNGNVDYQFDIQLLSTTANTFDPQYIKIKVDNDEVTTLSALTDSKIKTNLVLAAQQSIDVSIKVWLDINTPNTQIGKTFTSQLVINGVAVSPTTNYGVSAAAYITNLYNNANKTVVQNNNIDYNYATSVSLMNDRLGGTTKDLNAGNIRYYGASPNNYILFNCSDYSNQTSETCEQWRIIGVFDNMLKIIKNDYIGYFSWDTSPSDINNGYGINQWGQSTYTDGTTIYDGADLMKLLNPGYDNNSIEVDGEQVKVNNSLYWNRTTGNVNYFKGKNNAYTTSNSIFSNVGLTEETKKYIADYVWNLGGTVSGRSPAILYKEERGTAHSSSSYDNVIRTDTWTGKIALMYLSDYGYAADFEQCDTILDNYNSTTGDKTKCANNNWMHNFRVQYVLTSSSETDGRAKIRAIGANGSSGFLYGCKDSSVRPTLFLNSDSVIKDGNGSSSTPYQLK